MNRVILIGNLGGDPELRYTQNQTAVCQFSLATNKRTKDKDVTTWHRIVVWGKAAETCSKHLGKGAKIACEGELEYRKYTDKQGIERNVTEVHVNHHVEFLSPRKEGHGGGGYSQEGTNDASW